ncbi:MAG: ABC transporter ATP-binding protein/permease [Oscillospiraceae bacterium]|nr:ABC transporter ATP-binding protein/permease [Oscillospiraceae bacterium]
MDRQQKRTETVPVVPPLGMGGRGPGMGRGPADRFSPGEKAKDMRGTLSKLLGFYFKEGRLLFFAAVLILCETALGVLGPYFIGRGIDSLGGLDSQGELALGGARGFAVVLFFVYVGCWILNTAQGVLMNFVSQQIVKNLRKSLFDKLQKLPLAYHDAHSHGELMSRLTNDIDNISVTIAQSTTQLLSAAVTILGSLVMMISLSAYLTLASLGTVPLVFLLTKFVSGKSRKLFAGQQKKLGALNGMIEESVGGQRIIKAFGMERTMTEKFDNINKELLSYAVGANIWSGLLMPFMNVITNLGYVCVAFVGGALATGGLVSVGVIGSFAAYSRQFAFPLNNIAGMFNALQSALAGAERVFEVLSEAEEIPDEPNATDIGIPKGDVRFENVTFSYVLGKDVLKNVSFEVKAGQKIALVGATGSGKTTIVNLLSRFYDASSGAVFVDGKNIKSYKRESLRRAFSVVLQDTCLFTGTIADNIRYSRPDASDDEVEAAAAVANADAFIKRLKNGYGTLVSGDSDSLSQGQRQLLAISRAALCQAPILILDEATSSVDTRTERRIQEALLRLSSGRTSFVIAHRLSTIKDSDLIMVVKDGQIVESGSHDALLAQNGLYAQMYQAGI